MVAHALDVEPPCGPAKILQKILEKCRRRAGSLLHVAERTLGAGYPVRDYGLLDAALARPRATAFGKDAYPDVHAKAAALLHSIARNRALIDGNKRLSLAAVTAFFGLNGRRLTPSNNEAYDLVMSVAAGELYSVDAIAAVLQHATEPRR